jgi:LacI family transcriptional regulator
MKLKRATIKDISKESGYSVMTVSFALRNHEKVKPSTREKIQKVAAKLGYRPDPEIARLMERVRRNPELETSEPFAVLNLFKRRDDFKRDLFTNRVMEGAEERLKRHGFDLVEYWLGEKEFEPDAISKDLKDRNINVLLVPPVPPNAPLLDLDWSQFTVASIEERPVLPNFHRIHPNHYNNMLMLLDKLVDFGFTRIGFVSTPQMLGLDKYAYFGAFHSYFRYLHPHLPFLTPLPNGTEPKALKAWYREHKPEVVIVTAGWVEGAIRSSLGLSVPDDISVVSVGADFDPLAGIDQKADLIGSAAADLLMAHAFRYEKGVPPFAKTMLIDGEWKEGPSMRPLR